MKQKFLILTTFVALFGMLSCDKKDEERHDFSNTIGIVLYEPSNEFRTLVVDYAVKEAASLKCKYQLKLPATPAEQKVALQELVNDGIKTIVFGNLGVDNQFLNSLIAQGVQLVLYDAESECNYSACVTGDNPGLGARAGEFFKDKANVSKVVALTVPSTTSISDIRIENFKKALGSGKTVVEIPIKTYSDLAVLAVLDQILAANPDGVYVQDDIVAYALTNALKEKQHSVKAIFGAAGYQPYLRLMKNNTSGIELGSATYSPSYIKQCIGIAGNLLKGVKPAQKRVIVPSVMITKDNVDQFLKENGNF